MRYPEHLIGIMREDLTANGVEETRTPEAVDSALAPGSGTVLMIVNSVCGCAAGKARPGVVKALMESEIKPDVCVLDISMSTLSGIDAANRLKAQGSPAKVIFLTVHEDQDFLQAVLRNRMNAVTFTQEIDTPILE